MEPAARADIPSAQQAHLGAGWVMVLAEKQQQRVEAICSGERSILEKQSGCPLTLEHHNWSWVSAICRM